VSFSEAIYEGAVQVEDVRGVRAEKGPVAFASEMVLVVVDPDATYLPGAEPAAVVDARMTKQVPRPLPAGPAPVIGLGPGFTCGRNAHLVVETHREASLGAVIAEGAAAPDTGVPGVLGGQSALRVLRSPAAGHLSPLFRIGDMVNEGVVLGHVGGFPVVSTLKGLVRGLVHPEAELNSGTKVGDIDPRGRAIDPARISDKAQAVGEGVLVALTRLGIRPGR
jgi:xanthine dehydrogenase accessory factor